MIKRSLILCFIACLVVVLCASCFGKTEKETPEQTTMILTTDADHIIKKVDYKGPIYENVSLAKLIAFVVIGEAEGEPEEGKRLVIDTILNRVDSPDFPNTIENVIFQDNAFSCIYEGQFIERVQKASSDKDLINYYLELIREEELCRKDYRVLYFHAGHYGSWGTPLYSVGNHYFSY